MLADERKFEELILYVAQESRDDLKCGATKLNKILFYADFEAYHTLGRSITGQPYQKLERGPAPRRVVPVVERLECQGACRWEDRTWFGLPLRKLVALREPELSLFTPDELEVAQAVIRELWELNATEVSDLSHRFVGWQAADIGEEIPYGTVFVDEPRPLTEEEIAWAHEVIEEYLGRQRTA